MHANVTVKLEPIASNKPRVALDAAADVARRIGCHVEVAVNGRAVLISPTAAKSAIFDAWNAAATEIDAEDLNGGRA
jgi:hypothetical protein